jgi:hypothetical protein
VFETFRFTSTLTNAMLFRFSRSDDWGNSGEGDERQPPNVSASSDYQIQHEYFKGDNRDTNEVSFHGRVAEMIRRAFWRSGELYPSQLSPQPNFVPKCSFAGYIYIFQCCQ